MLRTTDKLARDHAKWVAKDLTLRVGRMCEPIETLARATVAQIDKLLMQPNLPDVQRESLERQRHNLAGAIQLVSRRG